MYIMHNVKADFWGLDETPHQQHRPQRQQITTFTLTLILAPTLTVTLTSALTFNLASNLW